MMKRSACLGALAWVSLSTVSVLAQSNAITGRDIGIERFGSLSAGNRGVGAFPNGASAFGIGTTSCNPGTDPIPFEPAMSVNHCFIHYILARESGGRLVQISDRSYVKHTFGSSNDPSICGGTCVNQATSPILEPGCNDAYAASQAMDNFNLGPPDEIDPWLGTWSQICSRFDQGDPVVGSAQQCDNVRSLTQTQANTLNNSLNHQPRVYDSDLNVAGATFWYQAGYLAPKEFEANRGNNIGSRQFTPTWTGSNWNFGGGSQQPGLPGTILQRWTGATISSAVNQNGANPPDDGRYFVAVKVTGPSSGFFHYEYAVHNRDNKRGMGSFRVPICSGARVTNFGFHDVDRDANDDWTATASGSQISFSTTGNPLRWNSIFNFWFDCDAAPVAGGALQLDQFDPGAGLPTVTVISTAPLALYNVWLGAGCSLGTAPTLFAIGSPDHATLGNATFGAASANNAPGALVYLFGSTVDGTLVASPCSVFLGPDLFSVSLIATTNASGLGVATFSLPVPSDPAAEGVHVNIQTAESDPNGAVNGVFDLSNGLRVRVGSALLGCP